MKKMVMVEMMVMMVKLVKGREWPICQIVGESTRQPADDAMMGIQIWIWVRLVYGYGYGHSSATNIKTDDKNQSGQILMMAMQI